MKFLYSDALLDLLVHKRMLTLDQRQFIILEKGKQRQKLLKQTVGQTHIDRNYPDLIDVIISMKLEVRGKKGGVLDEETIMRIVAGEHDLPFKKLDPLELDMDIATKTIPRNFAIRHMILPFNISNGILEVAVYHPDCQTVLDDIEQANQIQVKPYIATKADIQKIIQEFFGFQKSISAAEDQFGEPGVGGSVDIGNLERYVKISSANLALPMPQNY